MRRFLGALGFLTAARCHGAPAGEAALFFPLVGAALGWLGALWYAAVEPFFGSSIGALMVLGLWSLMTAAKGENGVARTIGYVTLMFLILMRWQALSRLPSNPVWELAACGAVSRGAIAAIGYFTPPLGKGLAETLTAATAFPAIIITIAAAFWPGALQGAVLLAGAILTVLFLRHWLTTRLGGVDTAGLHASGILTETVLLILATCRNCPWWSW